MDTHDGEALAALMRSEKKRRSEKQALLKTLEEELDKDGDLLDPVLAGNLIDKLYEADGAAPPQVTEEETADFIARITGENQRSPRPRFARIIRRPFRRAAAWWAAAIYGIVVFVFSVNYITALVSGACLVSRVEPRLCCGTKYCPCDPEAREKGL
jgi:hypothetical protein